MRCLNTLLPLFAGARALSSTDPAQQPLKPPASFTANLLNLHRHLVEQSSITGSEIIVSNFLKTYLEDIGFTVETQKVENNRENVLAYLNNSRENKVLVTSHIDTVPPYLPYERRGDEIWGRGSVDAKGSVASQIIAVKSLIESREIDEGDVALLYVVGEEKGGLGMKAANDLDLSWDAVIFGEPTELKLASGHKGGMGFTLTAKGKAGHSGYPETGRNAIDILVKGLTALQTLQWPWSDKFGNTTVNIGKIEGGVASNVIAENATASALIRIAAGSPGAIQTLIKSVIADVSPDLYVEFIGGSRPVPIDDDIDGFESVILNYGTDIPNLNGKHKRYLYGPGTILEAHSAHEHLLISDLEEAVYGYTKIIKESLARGSKSD